MAWLPDLQHVSNTAFKHLTTTISNLEAKLLPYILTFPSQASDEDNGDDDDEKMDEGNTPKKALSTVWIIKVPGVCFLFIALLVLDLIDLLVRQMHRLIRLYGEGRSHQV